MRLSKVGEFYRQFGQDSGRVTSIVDAIQATQPVNRSGTRALRQLYPLDPAPDMRSLSFHGLSYHVIDRCPGTDGDKTLFVAVGDHVSQEIDLADGLIRRVEGQPARMNNFTGVLFQGSGVPVLDGIRYGSSSAPHQIGSLVKRFGTF